MTKQNACLPARQGFTLIEILVVISVIILIVSITNISYRYFERNTELTITAQKIVSVIKLAQNKAVSSEGDSQYGVHFESNKYILFKGITYQEGADDNIENTVSSSLEINNINLTGEGSNIVFQKINGRTEQDGTINLVLISEPNNLETINIHSSGQIELASLLSECCNTNYLTDNRHVHFDLGWSIQNAITLTFYSSEIPEATVDINMFDYFNIDKTEFDWDGVININGQNQTLKIHTHFLDEFNTVLCIHRDGSLNNKPLQILIDNKDITSYTAEGEVSVGFLGGIMEIQ